MAASSFSHHSLLHCRKHRFAVAGAGNDLQPSSIGHPLFNRNAKQLYLTVSAAAAVSGNASSSPVTPLAAPSSSPPSPSLQLLETHLSAGNYRQADEVTRRLLIDLAGEPAKRRGYVFFSEVQFISADDLSAIDALWVEHSGGRFGYSVQRRVWEKARRDFTGFFIRVGWMKKLDTEIEQYNYRSFPDEFIWELDGDTPVGHLPLTNALRGTQLLARILTHPAFEETDDDEETPTEDAKIEAAGDEQKSGAADGRAAGLPKVARDFKPDYSF